MTVFLPEISRTARVLDNLSSEARIAPLFHAQHRSFHETLESEVDFLRGIEKSLLPLTSPEAQSARTTLHTATDKVARLHQLIESQPASGSIPLLTRRYDIAAHQPEFLKTSIAVQQAHDAVFALGDVRPLQFDDAARGLPIFEQAPATHPLVTEDPQHVQDVARKVIGATNLPFKIVAHGAENIPKEGAFILAPTHGSVFDSTIVYWMGHDRAIHTMTHAPQPITDALRGTGAFPVERGEGKADEALAVARALLAKGEGVAMYPEGTITRADTLARPRSGVGRLAVESQAPVVPAAAYGNKAWYTRPFGFERPEVHVVFGKPVQAVGKAANYRNAEAMREKIWSGIEQADADARRYWRASKHPEAQQ